MYLPSSNQHELPDTSLWLHPMLNLYESEVIRERQIPTKVYPSKLYLVPTLEFDGDESFGPQPTPLHELPEINDWVSRYVLGVVEIWNGRRQPMQLARWSHRRVHQQIVARPHILEKTIVRIRKIYIGQPIDGVAEVTATLRCGERIRALSLRFEGVDRRWLCTEMIFI
jgi:Family of unknown function (DUF6459)